MGIWRMLLLFVVGCATTAPPLQCEVTAASCAQMAAPGATCQLWPDAFGRAACFCYPAIVRPIRKETP